MRRLSRKDFLKKTATLGFLGASYPALRFFWQDRYKKNESSSLEFETSYVKAYYKWYQKKFFDFSLHTSYHEKSFIQACLHLMPDWSFEAEKNIHISLLSFSHKIWAKGINSSRMAIGSLEHSPLLQGKIANILAERSISKKDISIWDSVHGLAWDFVNKEFKLYSYQKDIFSQRSNGFQNLATNIDPKEYHHFGIEALSYRNNRIYERKIYLYPKKIIKDPQMPSFLQDAVTHSTQMFSEKRGLILQNDIDYTKIDLKNFTPKIKMVLAQSQNHWWPLDTISYEGSEQVTLYF